MMHTALGVDFWLVGARRVSQLGASQDVEVIISSMPARVALGTDRGSWLG